MTSPDGRRAGPAAFAGAVTFAAMVATPLAPKRGPLRRSLSTLVVTGLFTTTAIRTAHRWGTWRCAMAAASTVLTTTAVELVGTRTGRPFGHYRYTDSLRPQLGGVPVIVPLAWFAMAVPSREVARAASSRVGRRRAGRVVLGAAALTAWDLFLDPQMVGEGYWRWRRPGRYRGIPGSNYLGWFATALGVMAVLEAALPPSTAEPDTMLVGEYASMAAMETVGFAAFFRDPLVAVCGGVAMGPIAAAGLRAVWSGDARASRASLRTGGR